MYHAFVNHDPMLARKAQSSDDNYAAEAEGPAFGISEALSLCTVAPSETLPLVN